MSQFLCIGIITWVKVQKSENTEISSWGPQGPRWVQGNALAGGSGGRRPPEVPGF
ncbi:hypothetical protein DPMN_085053 [Dreissena polymorpha]|uniref:Uncharacterized protein n=1 Tax=Dreissena polymorpha TaxID=45954 RepID=A0A9D3YC22_DREPO|nr:hypothetical protein DPMN_085053 [Dreissena polymorpha]